MNETLNVSGALLVKLFGRAAGRRRRASRERAARRARRRHAPGADRRWFFLGLSLVGARRARRWSSGWAASWCCNGAFTIGTIVAFGAYLGQLYGPLSALTNARVEFATSLVSFERVFEVLDLPLEIGERPDAVDLDEVAGEVRFEDVSFSYQRGRERAGRGGRGASSEVTRFGRSAAIARPCCSSAVASLARAGTAAATATAGRRGGRGARGRAASRAGRCDDVASRCSRANSRRWSAPAARARRRSPTCCRACTTRPRAASARRPRPARPDARLAGARRSAW